MDNSCSGSSLSKSTEVCAAILLFAASAMPMCGQTFTTLWSFTGGADGKQPSPVPLTRGTDGNLYGTTWLGGTTGADSGTGVGTFFRITPGGTLTALYSFTHNDGITIEGALIQATDGNFYGTNTLNGANNEGTVFRITPNGSLTTLYSFGSSPTDGSYPNGALVQGTDGNLYGMNETGGANGYGAIFKVTPGGTFTTLYSFTVSGGCTEPKGGLIQGTDGNFYGTCSEGSGLVFRMTPGGTVTIFKGTSPVGSGPQAGLIQAADGNFYGTDNSGVFKMTLAGTLTLLSDFNANTSLLGGGTYSGLIQATDGNLYGTATGGGANGAGFIFRVTLSGAATIFYNFSQGTDGGSPHGVIQGTDGNLYGTGLAGGANGYGTVYRLTLPSASPQSPAITAIVPIFGTTATIQPSEWVSIYGTNLASATATWNGNFPVSLGGTSVTINGKSAYLWYVSPVQINLQAPGDTATGSVQVVVTTSAGSATSTVTLAQFAPSFLLLDSKHVTGIILRSNGSGAYGGGTYDIIGPTGSSLGYPTVAAKAGDIVELYAVGLGPTSPSEPAGQAYSGAAPTTDPVTLLINNMTVVPLFSGLTGAGLYQLNLMIPSGLGTGDVPLQAMVGGLQTQAGVAISLQ
jgi:uncharacterized protein (TIGR03437 family)